MASWCSARNCGCQATGHGLKTAAPRAYFARYATHDVVPVMSAELVLLDDDDLMHHLD